MKTQYVLEVGEAANARLQLLHRAYGSGTEELLAKVGIDEGMQVADIGCGTGNVSMRLAEKIGPTGTVLCVDNSCEQLNIAKTTANMRGLTNVRFLVSNVNALDLPDDSFDIVYCRFLLDHLVDPSVAIEQMHRILRPRGALVTETIDFTGMTCDPPQSAYAREIRLIRQLNKQRSVDAGSGLKVHRLFRSSRFNEINVSVNQPTYLTGEEKRFWEYSVSESASTLINLGFSTADQERRRVDGMRAVNLDDSILVALPRCIQVWARK